MKKFTTYPLQVPHIKQDGVDILGLGIIHWQDRHQGGRVPGLLARSGKVKGMVDTHLRNAVAHDPTSTLCRGHGQGNWELAIDVQAITNNRARRVLGAAAQKAWIPRENVYVVNTIRCRKEEASIDQLL